MDLNECKGGNNRGPRAKKSGLHVEKVRKEYGKRSVLTGLLHLQPVWNIIVLHQKGSYDWSIYQRCTSIACWCPMGDRGVSSTCLAFCRHSGSKLSNLSPCLISHITWIWFMLGSGFRNRLLQSQTLTFTCISFPREPFMSIHINDRPDFFFFFRHIKFFFFSRLINYGSNFGFSFCLIGDCQRRQPAPPSKNVKFPYP